MGATDFGSMQPQKKLAWRLKAYEEMTDKFFFTKMLGQEGASVIEHITELSKNAKGEAGAFFHLISRITGGGSVGDNRLKGRERSLTAHWQKVNFDQIRNGVVNKGKLADQKSVIQFRRPARKALSEWLADSWEDQAILTASGISFALNTDGSPRITPEGQDPWTDLEYAADVRAPSANRHFRWSASGGLVAGDTDLIVAADLPSYGMLPSIKAKAKTKRIPPIRAGGKDYYILLVHEETMAHLYRDADFRASLVGGDTRGDANKLFTGAVVTMNGLIIHPYVRVFNTSGATNTNKWGTGGTVDGTRSLLLGAQALALADLGSPEWDEEETDYGNRQGISIAKMGGWLKPQFPSSYDGGSVEDFGMMAIDHAI